MGLISNVYRKIFDGMLSVVHKFTIGGNIYHVKDVFGGYLNTTVRAALVSSGPLNDPEQIPLLLYIPSSDPGTGYLISSRGWSSLLAIHPSVDAKIAIPFRVGDAGHGRVVLRSLTEDLPLIGPDRSEGRSRAPVRFARSGSGPAEEFGLVASKAGIKSKSLRLLLRGIDSFTALRKSSARAASDANARPERLADFRAKMIRYDLKVLECCEHALDEGDLDYLARMFVAGRLRADPRFRTHLGDFWLDHGLRGLAALSLPAEHQAVAPRSLGPAFDHLDTEGFDGRFVSFSHRLTCHARRLVRPSREACIVATARNEGPYLLDWIAYHKSIGFEQIFIYSNNNDDGSDDILRALDAAGEIRWFDNVLNAKRRAQLKAYGHAFSVMTDVLAYKWTAIIDLDEYIVLDPRSYRSLADYLSFHERNGSDVIHLNWNIIGSAGRLAYEREPLFRRFQERLAYDDGHTKCIARTHLCMHSHPHYPVLTKGEAVKHVDAAGGPFVAAHSPAFTARPMLKPACVNHYFYKSWDEFVSKFSRNRGDDFVVADTTPLAMPEEFRDLFLRQFNEAQIEIDTTAEAGAPDFDERVRALMALPGVVRALAEAEAWHRGRVDRIKQGLPTPASPRAPLARAP